MASARKFITQCDNCKEYVHVLEFPMRVPGGKEKEEARCPKCSNIVYEAMTDGWFEATIVSEDEYKKDIDKIN